MYGYVIVLTNGKIIYLNADEVEWNEKTRMAKFISERRVVARINMDNVAGWIDMDHTTDSSTK